MVNPPNCLHSQPASALCSIHPSPVSVSALCANQPLVLKKPFATKVQTRRQCEAGATGLSTLVLHASQIAPCLCCDIRCRVRLEVFLNALRSSSKFFSTFPDSSCPLRVDGTRRGSRTPCYASPPSSRSAQNKERSRSPLSRNIRQLWRFRGGPETHKLASAANPLAGTTRRRNCVGAVTWPCPSDNLLYFKHKVVGDDRKHYVIKLLACFEN